MRSEVALLIGPCPSGLDGEPLYCSSLTFSIHCTAVPSRCSVIAMCVMDACGDAPCQCF